MSPTHPNTHIVYTHLIITVTVPLVVSSLSRLIIDYEKIK